MYVTEQSIIGLKMWVAHLKMQNKNGNNLSGGWSIKFKAAELYKIEIVV